MSATPHLQKLTLFDVVNITLVLFEIVSNKYTALFKF